MDTHTRGHLNRYKASTIYCFFFWSCFAYLLFGDFSHINFQFVNNKSYADHWLLSYIYLYVLGFTWLLGSFFLYLGFLNLKYIPYCHLHTCVWSWVIFLVIELFLNARGELFVYQFSWGFCNLCVIYFWVDQFLIHTWRHFIGFVTSVGCWMYIHTYIIWYHRYLSANSRAIYERFMLIFSYFFGVQLPGICYN